MSRAALLEFSDPPATVRPLAMWLWNGELRPAQLTRQIASFQKKDLGGFFIHPMPREFRPRDFPNGMTVEYLSAPFMDRVRRAVREAKKAGLQAWLYDEGGWPSGLVNGQILEKYPELQARVLRFRKGKFQVEPIPGRTDLLNPRTTDIFLERVYEKYKQSVGDEFGRTIPGMFTDEPFVPGYAFPGTCVWTGSMEREFARRKGYPLGEYLPLIFARSPEEKLPGRTAGQVRWDFADVWTSVFEDSYFKPIHRWCRQNGLLFTGHLGGEDNLRHHALLFGHFMKLTRHFDVPGIDAIWRQIFPGRCTMDFPKLAASVAAVHGRGQTISESFAVYGWGLTPAQMKWVTDFQGVRGITRFALMAFLAEDRSSRVISIGRNFATDPYADQLKSYCDYAARLGWFGSFGSPVARLGVYYPVSTLWQTPALANTLSRSFAALGRDLLSRQHDFDYLDHDALISRRCKVTCRRIQVGPREYQHLIVPAPARLEADLIEKMGPGNYTIASADSRSLRQVLKRIEPTVRIDPPNPHIRCRHRRRAKQHLFLLTNEGKSEFRGVVTFPVAGEPSWWNLETGEVVRRPGGLGGTGGPSPSCPVSIPAFGSQVVGFGFKGAFPRLRPFRELFRRSLQGGWTLRPVRSFGYRASSGVRSCRMTSPPVPVRLGDWQSYLAGAFSGTAEYETSFMLDCQEQAVGRMVLDLGKVNYTAAVRFNGRSAGIRLWPPYRFDVTALLKQGRNEISVAVTNTLANVMTDPKVRRMLKRNGWINAYYLRVEKFDRPMSPSGLIGPVALVASTEVMDA